MFGSSQNKCAAVLSVCLLVSLNTSVSYVFSQDISSASLEASGRCQELRFNMTREIPMIHDGTHGRKRIKVLHWHLLGGAQTVYIMCWMKQT